MRTHALQKEVDSDPAFFHRFLLSAQDKSIGVAKDFQT
jgi:hypothetical protein